MANILIVTELFHPSMGGQEVRYLELGGLCVRNGWSVDVATIGTDSSLPKKEDVNGITVHRLIQAAQYRRPGHRLPRNPLSIANFAWNVRKHLSSHRYEAIIFNLFPVLPQLLVGTPSGTVTALDWCEHRSTGIWPILNRFLSQSTQKHLSVSEGLKTTLSSRYSMGNIACVPSGIFVKDYSPSLEKRNALFFGRISEHKRPEEAILAVIAARDLGYTEGLTVAGDGPLLPSLRQKYGKLPFIHILGRVSDSEKRHLFATHKIHILPSIREGFPRTVAEAMASGTPTITTSHPDNGTADVVNQYSCGLVVEPGPDSIARAVVSLSSDKSQWDRMSADGLKGSAELDWERIFEKLASYLGVN